MSQIEIKVHRADIPKAKMYANWGSARITWTLNEQMEPMMTN
jgi:hypothetical protein